MATARRAMLITAAVLLAALGGYAAFTLPFFDHIPPAALTEAGMVSTCFRVKMALDAGQSSGAISMATLPERPGYRNSNFDEWKRPLILELTQVGELEVRVKVRSDGENSAAASDDLVVTGTLRKQGEKWDVTIDH